VVVILMSADRGAAAVTGRALAGALGWRCADAVDPHPLYAIAAAVLGRREHLVVTSPVFSAAEQAIVRGDLRNVRFVDLATAPADPDAVVRSTRHEFGL
jgi:hypothetical protein